MNKDELSSKTEKKYAPPNVRVQQDLVDSLRAATYWSTQYLHHPGTSNMRRFMASLKFAFDYFEIYQVEYKMNSLSDADKEAMKLARQYYRESKIKLNPDMCDRLLWIIKRIAFKSGSLNVHQTAKPSDTGW